MSECENSYCDNHNGGSSVCAPCDWHAKTQAELTKLRAELEGKNQALWEAYQFIGASIIEEQPEQDSIDIMDKLCKAMGIEKTRRLHREAEVAHKDKVIEVLAIELTEVDNAYCEAENHPMRFRDWTDAEEWAEAKARGAL